MSKNFLLFLFSLPFFSTFPLFFLFFFLRGARAPMPQCSDATGSNNKLFNSLSGRIPDINHGRFGRARFGNGRAIESWSVWPVIQKLIEEVLTLCKCNIHPRLWWRNGLTERSSCRCEIFCLVLVLAWVHVFDRWDMDINWNFPMMEKSHAMLNWILLCYETVSVRHWWPAPEPYTRWNH